jgi:hypothetical protein
VGEGDNIRGGDWGGLGGIEWGKIRGKKKGEIWENLGKKRNPLSLTKIDKHTDE